ncbi:hypothetical protein LguiB_002170 [Lonicera macranthoides]
MHILSNHLLNGKPILVKYAFLDPAMPFFEVGRIFIKNLDKSITLEALRGAFSAFGKILSCVILRDLGCATVCFDNMEASLRALEQMHKFFKGTNIYIDSFMSEEDNALAAGERRKEEWLYLYIDNIDERIGDGHLLRLFSRFGVITSYEVRTYYGRLGREPRLVAFSTPMEGFTACSAMHGQLVGNKRLYVVPDGTEQQFSEPQPAGVEPFVRADPGQAPRECRRLQPERVHLVRPDPEEEEDDSCVGYASPASSGSLASATPKSFSFDKFMRKSSLSSGLDELGLALKHHFEYINGRTYLEVIYRNGRRTIVLNEDFNDLLRVIKEEHSQFYDEDTWKKELISQEKIMSKHPNARTHVNLYEEESSSGNETLQPSFMQEFEPVPQYNRTTYPFGPQQLLWMNQNIKGPTKIMSSLKSKQKLE